MNGFSPGFQQLSAALGLGLKKTVEILVIVRHAEVSNDL